MRSLSREIILGPYMFGKLDIKSFFLLSLLIVIEVLSTTSIIKYTKNKNYLYIIGGLIGYLLVGILFYLYLEYYKGSFVIGNIIWQVCNVLFVTFIGILYYKKSLSNKEIYGILLIIIGLLLI